MAVASAQPKAFHLAALAALSAAVLAFEVLLLRLFEFSHWHHFAGFAIALALLGLGAAGTVLALIGERAVRAGDHWFLVAALVTALALLVVLVLQARIAVRPLFALSDAAELARLLLLDLAAFLPFFCAGLAIGQVFPRWPQYPGRLYSANLLGSAAGSAGASLLLMVALPETALALVAAMLAGVVALAAFAVGSRITGAGALVVLLLAGGWSVQPPAPAVSDFKALARVLALPDSRVLASDSGLRGRTTVVRSDSLRFTPGLSLQWREGVAPMDALVRGSDSVLPLPREFGERPEHARAALGGLPLRLRSGKPLLVLGTSDWSTPTLAGARRLTWVEADPQVLAQVRARRPPPSWRLVRDDPLRALADTQRRYGLIALDAAFAGGDAASADYLMTVEGLASALRRLHGDGLLALPLPVDYPPRRGPRALATLSAALERAGATAPGAHIAAVRGPQAMLMLASPQPLAPADRARIEAFAERWRFDKVWLPGMPAAAANRYHVLERPVFHEAARALFAGGRLPAVARWFETAPAYAERPYFWRDMRWSRLPDLLAAQGRRALSLLDWTLVMSAGAAAATALLAFALILAPLGRLPRLAPPLGRLEVAGLFAALGVGFMFVEMAVFQRAILYLGEPVLAASLVFAVFMAGSGVGAAMPPRVAGRPALARIYGLVALGFALVIAGLWLGDGLLAIDAAPVRALALIALMLPLTWALGRALPWALGWLADQPRWLPWAWGINGFASVLAISLAPLVSVQWGQWATLGVALLAYACAAAIAWRWAGRVP